MGNKTRKRPRDLPHPKKAAAKPKIKRARTDFNGSRSRAKATKQEATKPSKMGKERRRRVKGTNGSWPANAQPKPPVISLFVEDLAADDPAPVFGQFPVGFITKMLPWMDVGMDPRRILHLCSGSLKKGQGIRVDIRPEAKPDILADCRNLPLEDGSVAAAMADPPYTEQYARDLYDVEYPLPAHVLREAARVVRPGGVIAFVHYLVPMPPPGCTFERVFGLSMGFGFPMRAVTLYRRNHEQLPLFQDPPRERHTSAPSEATCG